MTYDELIEWGKTLERTEDQILRTSLYIEKPWDQDIRDLLNMFMEGTGPYKETFKVWWSEIDETEQEVHLEHLQDQWALESREDSDRGLMEWATTHGWKYFTMNRQLQGPDGSLVTVQNWDTLPDSVRAMIMKAKTKEQG